MTTRLTHFIYRLLLEEPQTGYSLAKNIQERTGWKPSWGSIYPSLEKLEEQQHIKGKKTGRSTTYTLTAKGKKHAEKELTQTKELLAGLIERTKILNELVEEDLSIPIAYFSELQEGINPFTPINTESERMKKEIYRLWKEKKISTHANKINQALKETTKQLKKL